jgi:mRNA interferase YafQ
MYSIQYSTQFKKDFKKLRKLPIGDLKIVFEIITKLEKAVPLEVKFRDHDLHGNYKGFRECHIKPDLLLIYKVRDTELMLARVGSHSELF